MFKCNLIESKFLIQSEFYLSAGVTKGIKVHNKIYEKSWEIVFGMNYHV